MEQELRIIELKEQELAHDIEHYEKMIRGENMEKLLKIAEELEQIETEYEETKHELNLLKAQYTLFNEWEKVLNKARPTVQEKEAYIKTETEVLERKVTQLKVKRNHARRVYEINMLSMTA